MGMMGNFYDELNLEDGRREVRAGGHLRWSQMPGIQRVRVIAAITQGQTYGSGSREFARPASGADDDWWCDVHAEDGGRFEADERALAAGVVVVLDPADWGNPWPWPGRPLLR
jgi:hypothetical protein